MLKPIKATNKTTEKNKSKYLKFNPEKNNNKNKTLALLF